MAARRCVTLPVLLFGIGNVKLPPPLTLLPLIISRAFVLPMHSLLVYYCAGCVCVCLSTVIRGWLCSPFVGGNWKLNGSFESIAELADAFNAGEVSAGIETVIFPTMIAVDRTRSLLKNMKVGAQNVSVQKGFGAMTGEISPQLLVEAGIEYVLTGHSERRHKVAHESSELIAQKTLNAIEAGLTVILCIGEKLEEREAGTTIDVLKEQMVRLCVGLFRAPVCV